MVAPWGFFGLSFLSFSVSQLPCLSLSLSLLDMDHSLSLNSLADQKNGRLNLNERKAELLVAEECKDKEIGGESEVAAAKRKRETSIDTDYIHDRARRGQATDSHSLAERARREKINKKMKCLQDLVPGCSKVTGKAGMLEEIINYVQSLQRQVEFLSMKLASLNPRIDFDIDSFFMKEFPAYVTSSSGMVNLAYLQFIQAQQGPQAAQTTTSSSIPVPNVFLDSLSCFPQDQTQPISTWGTDFHTLRNAEFC
ncbi:hypothetical protein ACSBR1_025390 [Camellia fascicularis]